MKATDYSQIASRYDNNRLRHDISRDDNIERLYRANSSRLSVLDLACGTGNYLIKQISEYRGHAISWIGIDNSPEMLEIANQKSIPAKLIVGDACKVPLRDCSVDYVKVRFAFHHFSNKEQAVAEMRRVLRSEGAVSILNLSHDYMKNSWVCRYFPGAEPIDRERFPETITVHNWFTAHGFEVTAHVHTTIKRFGYKDLLEEVENRDMSQLNLISEQEYRTGCDRLRADAQRFEYLVADIAFLDLYAEKTA